MMCLLRLLSRLLPESEPLEFTPAKELVQQAEDRLIQPIYARLLADMGNLDQWRLGIDA